MNRVAKKVVSALGANRRLIPAFGLIAVLAVLLTWRAGYDHHVAALKEMDSLAERYSAYRSIVDSAEEIKNLKGAYDERLKSLETGLLAVDKASIGVARLQEAFKALVSKKNTTVTSQKALTVKSGDRYVRVPVEFQVKASLSMLKNLLYDIQTSPVLMGVRYVRIKAAESGAHGNLDATIVLEGVIMKQSGG